MSRLAKKYHEEIIPSLAKEFNLANLLAVPKLTKITINIGLKEAAHDAGVLTKTAEELAVITGQKPKVCQAKKSIAAFKIAKGNPIGLMVTLRGERMYDFFDKLLNIVLPRVRDFRGASPTSFDGHGNYSLGLAEHTVFPEVEFAKTEKVRGLEITVTTNAGSDEKAKKLLELLGVPFAKSDLAQAIGSEAQARRGKPIIKKDLS